MNVTNQFHSCRLDSVLSVYLPVVEMEAGEDIAVAAAAAAVPLYHAVVA